jgi:toxin CcdB
MAQFDVYVNPITAARRAYPFVVALQADFTLEARGQIVAPLVQRTAMPPTAGRLTPVVGLLGVEHVVLMPALANIRARDLAERHCSIASARGDLLAAIDYLFFGV